MGKIGKPQKKKKNKIRTFGWHKNNDTLNRAPKNLEQEVPRKLLELGVAIKEAQSGKSSKNKFKSAPDGPSPNDAGKSKTDIKGKKYALKPISREDAAKLKMGKKMQKMTLEATEEYINNLKPARPFLDNFQFKKKPHETKQDFMDRVRRESHIVVAHSKIAEKSEQSAEYQIKFKAKEKLKAEKKEKLLQTLKAKETPKPVTEDKEEEEPKEIKDFYSKPDDIIPFGEVVHAPPTLSVLPKKATAQGRDRPGARMPELKEAFSQNKTNTDPMLRRKKGKTVKRKHLTLHQQFESDAKREQFVELYRQMKKDAKSK